MVPDGETGAGDSCCMANLNFINLIKIIIFDYCHNIFYLRTFLVDRFITDTDPMTKLMTINWR
jgi:hypothetical protein